MGVFINNSDHPEVFQNKGPILDTNQGFAKKDYLSELIIEQKKANSQLNHSFNELKKQYQQYENNHANQWNELSNQLQELGGHHDEHEKFEKHVMNWLAIIDENNLKLQAMLEDEGIFKHDVVHQINNLTNSNQEMVRQLEEYKAMNEKFALKMDEQIDIQHQMSEQISKYEEQQHEVTHRLENQEALTEKILRQVNHLRSILFERTNDLAEKIENGYNRTSAYFYKLVTGTEHPRTVLVMNQKKEENSKSSD